MDRLSRCIPTLIVVTMLNFISTAEASSPIKRRLAQAKQQYIAQEYEQVIRLLTPAVQSPLATISNKVEAYELLGLSYLILGDKKRAQMSFENLLGLDPGHALNDPSDSPKLKEFYERVKVSFVPGYEANAKVLLEHGAPTRAIAGRKVEFACNIIRGKALVQLLLLHWRRAGLLTYHAEEMRERRNHYQVDFILPDDVTSYKLEYYLESRGVNGSILSRVGSPDKPLQITVTGTEVSSPGVLKKWWFWTAIGTVVASGLTLGVVFLARETAPTGNLEPGRIELQ